MLSPKALEIRPVRNGRGIVALRRFAPGALLCKLKGRVVSSQMVWSYWKTNPQQAANCIRFDSDDYLDPADELGAFANHSCSPNCGLFREARFLVFRAVKVIAPHDEVTHDYSTFVGRDDVWTMPCNCGESTCRRRVRAFHTLPVATVRKYRALGMIPDFILNSR